jgi:hypothetical protein
MIPLFLAVSCSTEQAAVPEEQPASQASVEKAQPPVSVVLQVQGEKEKEPEKPEKEEEPAKEEVFDPQNVSQEDYNTTIQNIQEMIVKLNNIVRAKNFDIWVSYLADSSVAKINSQEFLNERANDLHKKNISNAAIRGQDISRVRRITFRKPRDYFDYVVVPSHTNDHVDEIAFSSQTQVTAYTRDEKGQRLILYDLENINGQWKIIIVS